VIRTRPWWTAATFNPWIRNHGPHRPGRPDPRHRGLCSNAIPRSRPVSPKKPWSLSGDHLGGGHPAARDPAARSGMMFASLYAAWPSPTPSWARCTPWPTAWAVPDLPHWQCTPFCLTMWPPTTIQAPRTLCPHRRLLAPASSGHEPGRGEGRPRRRPAPLKKDAG
jgi:hypothetical protein